MSSNRDTLPEVRDQVGRVQFGPGPDTVVGRELILAALEGVSLDHERLAGIYSDLVTPSAKGMATNFVDCHGFISCIFER